MLYFLFGYIIGTTAHGLYDFFLFTETFLAVISVAMAGFFSYFIKKMLFYTLRDSQFYNPEMLPEIFRAGRILFTGMLLLFLFTAFSAGITSGSFGAVVDYAISNGISALFTTAILLALIGLDEKGYRKVLGIPAKN